MKTIIDDKCQHLRFIFYENYAKVMLKFVDQLSFGYFSLFFSYQNLTKKLKREWYNFQIGTNEFLTEIFGEDEEEDDDNQIKDKNDQ